MTRDGRTLLAIGSYTPGDSPVGDRGVAGLTTWWWDGDTGIRPAGSADLPSPSFASWHPTLPMLYAVSELGDGMVTALAVRDDGSLAVPVRSMMAGTATGGAQPCWVTTDPTGSVLLIANYGSGSMAALALDDSGLPVGDAVVVQHHGSGPVAGRQEGPHVHQVVPTADGHILVSDLGTDRITEYRIDPADPASSADAAVTVTEVGSIAMPAGSGPRHIALAAGGEVGFVTGELDGTVTVIHRERSAERTIEHRERGRSEAAASRRSRSGGERSAERTIEHRERGRSEAPDGPGGPVGRWRAAEQVSCSGHAGAQPSHLMLADGDRWLLVANRGPDTLAVLDVADGLAIRHELPTGQQPRHFAIHGDRVLVACQRAGTVQVLTLDPEQGTLTRDGVLAPSGSPAPWPPHAPACVAVRL